MAKHSYDPDKHGEYGEWRKMRMAEAKRRQQLPRPATTGWVDVLVPTAVVLVGAAIALFLGVQIWQEAARPSRPREPWRPCDERVEPHKVEACERDDYYGSLEDPIPEYRGRP